MTDMIGPGTGPIKIDTILVTPQPNQTDKLGGCSAIWRVKSGVRVVRLVIYFLTAAFSIEQRPGCDMEWRCKLLDDPHGGISLPALYIADIGPVDAGTVSIILGSNPWLRAVDEY